MDDRTTKTGSINTIIDAVLVHTKSPVNHVISPVGISELLQSLLPGAVGETADELSRFLDNSQANSCEGALGPCLGEGKKTKAATSPRRPVFIFQLHHIMLCSSELKVKTEYKSVLTKFGVELMQHKANDCTIIDQLNEWVRRVSNGKLKKMSILRTLKNTEIVLVNALYFKASWKFSFPPKNTTNQRFYMLDGSSKMVPTMTRESFACYANTLGDDWLIHLPLKTENQDCFAMVIVLPDNRKGINSLVVPTDKNSPIFQELDLYMEAKLFLPKFTIAGATKLKSSFEQAGVTRIFKQGQAQLQNITNDVGGLHLSKVAQTVSLEVDENGVEGVPVLYCGGHESNFRDDPKCKPATIRVDHAFLFYVVNCTQKNVLFAGRVTNPSS